MSLSQTSLWAPLPSTTRGSSTPLSYDPTTDRIAYASRSSIFIRSVSNPELSWQFTGHTHATTVARFSPSGFYMASGDESGKVHVWDCSLEGSQVIKSTFQILSGRINDLAWDADSKRLIAVGDGKEKFGHCFTFDTGNSVGELSGHAAAITAVAIRPVRPYRAVTVGNDAAMVVLSAPPYKFTQSVRGHHTNFIRDVKYAPDGEHLVSVGADRSVVVYNGAGEHLQTIANAHEGGIFAVTWISATEFATASADSTVKRWSVEGEVLQTWTFSKAVATHQVGLVATRSGLVSLSLSGELTLLDSEPLVGHQTAITALAVKEGEVYSASAEGRVVRWVSGKAAYTEAAAHTNMVVGINVTDAVSTVGWDDKLIVGSLVTSLGAQPKGTASFGATTVVVTETELRLYGPNETAVALSEVATCVTACEGLIVVGAQNGSLVLYTPNLTPGPVFAPLRSAVARVALSASGAYLAAADATGKIVLYDAATGLVVTSRWSFHNARVTSMSWLGDEYLVSGSLDEQIIVYSVARPAKNIKISGAHYGGVTAVAWLDQTVVSGGNDGAVKVWQVTFHD